MSFYHENMPLFTAFESLRVSKSCEHTVAGEVSVFYRSCESAEGGLSIKQQHLQQLWEPTATTRAPHRKQGCCET